MTRKHNKHRSTASQQPPPTQYSLKHPTASQQELPDLHTLSLDPTTKLPSTSSQQALPDLHNLSLYPATLASSASTSRSLPVPPTPTPCELQKCHQVIQQVHELADEAGGKKKFKERLVRKTVVSLPSDGHPLEISSFRFNEFLYKREPCPFPTRARGLFTYTTEEGIHKVAARGYDKFFNIGEVSSTQWKWISENTHGPYEVTLKENGCIIFVAARPDGRGLLVTSKHAVQGSDRSPGESTREHTIGHADVGAVWVKRHLNSRGRTEKELETVLRAANVTAVFELCDDEFEEHILPYVGERRGLYLHGLNQNTVEFATLPSSAVRNFAQEWGFHETTYVVRESADQVVAFTDDVKNEGQFQGRSIEGFVVRTKKTADGTDFFFKIKYDEPYLMYREWREVTLRLLSGIPTRCTYPLTAKYVAWTKEKIEKDPKLFERYKLNQGIIQVRDLFLKDMNAGLLKDPVQKGSTSRKGSDTRKVLIMPVGTIGCGKTTISLVLSDLFGFGHVQNDNIVTKKKPGAAFEKAVIEMMKKKDVVIADRNNHLGCLRESLTKTIKSTYPNCRIVTFYWNVRSYLKRDVLKTTSDRVKNRGENHQSLTPGRNPRFESVIESFVDDFEPLDSESREDEWIDDVVEFSVTSSLRTNARIAVDAVVEFCRTGTGSSAPPPTDGQIEESLAKATNEYLVTVVKDARGPVRANFYGIQIDSEKIRETVHRIYSSSATSDRLGTLWTKMKTTESFHRSNHHVTLLHRREVGGNPKLKERWTSYDTKISDPTSRQSASFRIGRLIQSDSVLVLEVISDSFRPSWIAPWSEYPHVTVAVTEGTNPFEGHETLKRFREWEKSGKEGEPGCWVVGNGEGEEVTGVFKAFA